MIITCRIEKYYKVELTAEQAHEIEQYLGALQARHIDEIAVMLQYDMSQKLNMGGILNDLKLSLRQRDEKQ